MTPTHKPPGARKGMVKMSAYCQAELIKLLWEGDYQLRELAEETGLHYVTVCEYVRELKRVKMVHIVRRDPDRHGQFRCPIYKLGPGRDADRIRLTGAQRQARRRQKLRDATLLGLVAKPTKTELEPA